MVEERGLKLGSVFALALILATCGTVYGNAMPASAHIIQIEATSNGHTATFTEAFPVTEFSGNLGWALGSQLKMMDGAYTVGTISNLEVNFNADPQIDLSFAIKNNSLQYPVMFNISTATILFDPVANAQAAATASITLTQGAGSSTGAYINGLFSGGKLYQARYSTHDIINTQTVFASLAPSMSFDEGWGVSETETLPALGLSNLGTTVYMMESEFKFTLSPGDLASGTSAFMIIPEPASLVLLMVGLAFIRRR